MPVATSEERRARHAGRCRIMRSVIFERDVGGPRSFCLRSGNRSRSGPRLHPGECRCRPSRARHLLRLRDVERRQQWPAQSGKLRVVVARDFLVAIGVAAESLKQITDVV
jgi:hypothetical protein